MSNSKDGTRTVGPGSVHGDSDAQPLVSPRFLAWAISATIVAAAICGYLAMCLLFYQGQWQMVLHPEKLQAVPKNSLPHQDVRFFPSGAGQPQLDGWMFLADPTSQDKSETILYVPDGSGSMSSRLPMYTRLHDLGRNLFAFDYRGFGDSAAMHPSEDSLKEDAAAAIDYLTSTLHTPPGKILIYANGTGGVAALAALQQHPDICCIVLDNVRPSLLSVFQADSRTHLLPLHSLLKDEFNILPLAEQDMHPKLIFATGGSKEDESLAHDVYDHASGRKTFLDLYSLDAAGKSIVATRNFIDEDMKP